MDLGTFHLSTLPPQHVTFVIYSPDYKVAVVVLNVSQVLTHPPYKRWCFFLHFFLSWGNTIPGGPHQSSLQIPLARIRSYTQDLAAKESRNVYVWYLHPSLPITGGGL